MNIRFRTAIVAWLLLIPGGIFAEEQPPPATTPLNLLELLPEGGFAAVETDVYHYTQYSDGVGRRFFSRYHVYRDGENLVIARRNSGDVGLLWIADRMARYSPTGELVEMHHRSTYPDNRITGETYGKQTEQGLELWHARRGGLGDWQSREPSRILEEDRFANAIPEDWFQLAIGYHLRKEHESFVIVSRSAIDTPYTRTTRLTHLGQQTMPVAGMGQQTVHVLLRENTWTADPDADSEKTKFMPKPNEDAHTVMHCLDNGVIVGWDFISSQEGRNRFGKARTTDAEHLREIFGEAIDMPYPWKTGGEEN